MAPTGAHAQSEPARLPVGSRRPPGTCRALAPRGAPSLLDHLSLQRANKAIREGPTCLTSKGGVGDGISGRPSGWDSWGRPLEQTLWGEDK